MAGSACDADPDDRWPELKAGLERVYARMPMTATEYMRLYMCVYDTFPELGCNKPKSATSEVKVSELYSRMQQFLEKHVIGLAKRCNDLEGEEMQVFYFASWKRFEFASRVANGIFAYMNRRWIRSQIAEGRSSIMEIYPLALLAWKKQLFQSPHIEMLSRALVPCMQLERLGQTAIDGTVSVKALLDCFGHYFEPGHCDYRKALEHLLAISPTQYAYGGAQPYNKPRSLVHSCKGVLIEQYLRLVEVRKRNACSGR